MESSLFEFSSNCILKMISTSFEQILDFIKHQDNVSYVREACMYCTFLDIYSLSVSSHSSVNP